MHIFCKWGKWKLIGYVDGFMFSRARAVQERTCEVCGKIQFRTSNSVYGGGTSEALRVLKNSKEREIKQ